MEEMFFTKSMYHQCPETASVACQSFRFQRKFAIRSVFGESSDGLKFSDGPSELHCFRCDIGILQPGAGVEEYDTIG